MHVGNEDGAAEAGFGLASVRAKKTESNVIICIVDGPGEDLGMATT